MIAWKKENWIITQYIEDCEEIPEGFIEVTEQEIKDLKVKNQLETIDATLEANYDEYAKLEKASVKTPEQAQRFAYLQAAKTKLESDKQTLLNQA